jgi:hypothetical protein
MTRRLERLRHLKSRLEDQISEVRSILVPSIAEQVLSAHLEDELQGINLEIAEETGD